VPVQTFRKKDILPKNLLEDPNPYYIFTIHHLQYYMGYLIVSPDVEMHEQEAQQSWLVDLGMIFENRRIQRDLQSTVNRLEFLYSRDMLTGLYNRHGVEKFFGDFYDECREKGTGLAVMIFDMDDLKLINDNYGHYEGDHSIKAIASALMAASGDDEISTRSGGDEFVVILQDRGFDTMHEVLADINRVIEDMNHRFVLSVLERDFESHDLGSARQLDRKKKASMGLDSSLDGINTQEVVDRLRHILDIRNTDERNIKLTTDHVNEIKEYLYLLDLIVNCPVETIGADKPVEHIIFTQPGMRYCQAQALVHSLMKDEYFMSYPARERAAICDRILEEVRGRMLEEIVLLETMKSLPRNCRAFKLEFAIGEFDMVIFDQDRFETGIYEIKHTDKPAKEQCKHLLDKEKCAQVEHMYGTITSKYVLYRGENCSSYGVDYRNVEDFLKNSASI
jgi:diguanylate cyclase (GGDEF)-like protein